MQYKFTGIYTSAGWVKPGYVTVDGDGRITAISSQPLNNEKIEVINGLALPGFRNSHSHAFQYAMAGLAERHAPGTHDDFWTWRETMYQVALSMDPDQVEKVAGFLYAEMLRHGYTHVAEFHYLHHDKRGKPYANLAELGERIISAANSAGIKITLIPIFYQTGNFGQEPAERQRRFISKTYDDYMKLWEASEEACKESPLASVGIGVHSLRAVGREDILQTIANYNPTYPFHLHVSEQVKEVEDCLKFYGVRPVQWLLDNVQLTNNFHLVHATHLDERELKGIADSRANVILCPSTEGNLGDGIFRLKDFKNYGGGWTIGTDSHIGLNPLEEMRLLDYRERLVTHQRNILNDNQEGDSGAFGFNKVIEGGRKAMGDQEKGFLDKGNYMDAMVIRDNHPLLATSKPELLLSTLIYSLDSSQVLGTMINGKWVVKEGRHIKDKLRSDFVKVLNEIEIRG